MAIGKVRMSEAEIVERCSKPYTDRIATVGCLVTLATCLVYFAQPFRTLRVPLAFCLPIALVYGVALAAALYRKGTDDLPAIPLVVGCVFVSGGVALDGIATLMMTPTLQHEVNPVARALLDAGLPVGFVILYGITFQVLFTLLVCALWAAFLRHRRTLIASAWSQCPNSMSDFIKAAVGAAHLSGWWFFLPCRPSKLPTSYHIVWLVTAGLVGGSLFRWYLGLVWLDWVPWACPIVLVVSVLLPIAAYYVWLALEFSKGRVKALRSET
jgi:hypothetical protein